MSVPDIPEGISVYTLRRERTKPVRAKTATEELSTWVDRRLNEGVPTEEIAKEAYEVFGQDDSFVLRLTKERLRRTLREVVAARARNKTRRRLHKVFRSSPPT